MAKLVKDVTFTATDLKNRIHEICQNLLPSENVSFYIHSGNLPPYLKSTYLCTRSELLNDINNILVTEYSSLMVNTDTISNNVFQLLQKVFLEMGRCRKIYYYDAGYYVPGTQSNARSLATTLGIAASAGTWTYFKSNFKIENTNQLDVMPTTQNNGNKSQDGYSAYPYILSTNWNNNTKLASNASRVSSLNINQLIEAVRSIEDQLTNFSNTWQSKNNNTSWWDGNANNSKNASNKIFWVRYWCHSNCHSNCHGNRSRR